MSEKVTVSSDERGHHISRIGVIAYRFFTGVPGESGKKWHLSLLLVVLLCFVGVNACSSSKGLRSTKQTAVAPESSLVSGGEEEVTRKLGEPTVISRTPEGHILWVYRPSLKLLPNDKGTLYVEFDDGKVTKVFKKK